MSMTPNDCSMPLCGGDLSSVSSRLELGLDRRDLRNQVVHGTVAVVDGLVTNNKVGEQVPVEARRRVLDSVDQVTDGVVDGVDTIGLDVEALINLDSLIGTNWEHGGEVVTVVSVNSHLVDSLGLDQSQVALD
ncbi:hypothetical protein OGAPHI_000210 [Ogataea philodendri]|uniref:Uncharacterized protein n=1 Tax=Ogataea philodendri TaxID=1378263 RepID=A0A9P8PG96_9ASCO|nr:uncharacterized protein OGAPHI_000210 [Ogataea philodendri]KAH3671507.1 hypothetical protein OGAPHI_000210 [Ogataea philodendri]